MKQTAVEWYSKQLARIGVTDELIGHLTKEAKAMEKQQIIEAHNHGYWEGDDCDGNDEEYYNETFKSE